METFVKRYIAERTNKTETRPEEQSEKTEIVGRIYGMKYIRKGHKDRNRHRAEFKGVGKPS